MSQLTTHVLDTTKGKPAPGIPIVLYHQKKEGWIEVTRGVTNNDGRIPDLLKKGVVMELCTYKLRFETQSYFEKQSIQTFYPFVEITFRVTTQEHYHIPLLLNPFGYSTYRGS
ncbi:MAG TPA: hydroxyisourate hydrolase [Chitinophagaceae bacterium]|nr:hydroxyisourate hydrolase [Chitinophagaceae bacterium]